MLSETCAVAKSEFAKALDGAIKFGVMRIRPSTVGMGYDPPSYARGFNEALNYLEAALLGGREMNELGRFRDRLKELDAALAYKEEVATGGFELDESEEVDWR